MQNDYITKADAITALGVDADVVHHGETQSPRDKINAIPAADVAEVAHARWMETPKDGWTRMECSGCGHSYYVPANINPREWADDRNYCVKCGSRMDGGEHHAE